MNPLAVVVGLLTPSFKMFLLLTLISYFFVLKMSQIFSGAKAIDSLAQAEIGAAQRECNARLRDTHVKAAEEFTKRIVTNIKAMKKDQEKNQAKPTTETAAKPKVA